MKIMPITVVNEEQSIVEFDVAPTNAEANTYRMQIRQDPAGTGPADATFTITRQGSYVRCLGDCTGLVSGVRYYYDLEENGSAIVGGTVDVINKVTK